MGCYGSTSQKVPISASTASRRLQPWQQRSILGPERRSIGERLRRRLTSCFDKLTSIPLRRPLESALYVSIRYTERLLEAGIEPSVGSVGDSYDNALAE